jgi:molecular chaperone GrpE
MSDEQPDDVIARESMEESSEGVPSPQFEDLGVAEPEAESDTALEHLVPVSGEDSVMLMVEPAPAVQVELAALTTGEPELGREVVEAIEKLGARLEWRLDELQTLFHREIRAESTREKVVDRLHAELQEYKQDLLLSTLRPVFIDLIQLHDDIGKVAVAPEVPEGDGPSDAQRLVGLMQGFQQGIEDILYRQGVEPFQVEGGAFDPRRQRAVATVATDDPALNKTVAARLRKGFRAGERVIRPEIVSVYAVRKV